MTLWAVLIGWAALGVLWSPFQLSGIKMIGYLICYPVLAAVLLEGWQRRALSPGLLASALWLSLLLGAVQTWALGNWYGKLPGMNDDRFTSFCTPQTYAAFIASILSVLLITQRLSLPSRLIHWSGALAGLLLTGSRYVFIGALGMVVVVSVGYILQEASQQGRLRRLAIAVGAMLVVGAAGTAYFTATSTSRIGELLRILAEGDSPFERMGTLVWRRGIYDQAWQRLASRDPLAMTVGSGTSSGASIVLGYDLRYDENRVDANRVVHNEILRALYEWGIVGALLFISVLAALAWYFVRAALKERIQPAYAFLSLLPTLILGCLSENILAGSSSPAGVGLLISLTYGVAYCHFARARRTEARILHP
jgi:O-antigen ligase